MQEVVVYRRPAAAGAERGCQYAGMLFRPSEARLKGAMVPRAPCGRPGLSSAAPSGAKTIRGATKTYMLPEGQ